MCIEPGVSACLRCAFPQLPSSEIVPSCQTVGILGAACGVVGTQMALWGLRRLAPQLQWPAGQLWALDLRTDRRQELKVRADKQCRVCGEAADIDGKSVEDYETRS
jgi:molybdopterin/thiamine biosynthesis adenylyltransferase